VENVNSFELYNKLSHTLLDNILID